MKIKVDVNAGHGMLVAREKVADEFSRTPLLRINNPPFGRFCITAHLQLEFHPGASESIGLTLFASSSRLCTSLSPFSSVFLLVNSLTSRRHFAMKALTATPRPDGARGKMFR